jgi:hypothetical protein
MVAAFLIAIAAPAVADNRWDRWDNRWDNRWNWWDRHDHNDFFFDFDDCFYVWWWGVPVLVCDD